MTLNNPLSLVEANQEISALIESLLLTEQRLEELTGGEVDTVADKDGRMFLLRRAQNHKRENDAAKQAAILDALPAPIALLDNQGRVISVNAAWQRFSRENALQAPAHGIGLNYLSICDAARGDEAPQARQVAAGIRSILSGAAEHFSLEYPCHSPTEKRWSMVTATPMVVGPSRGAVVMHLDISERMRAEQEFRESERRFSSLLANVELISVMLDAEGRITYCNAYLLRLTGWRLEEVIGQDWFDLFITPELHTEQKAFFQTILANLPEAMHAERAIRTRTGEHRNIRWNSSVLRSGYGRIIGVASIGEDITETNKVTEELRFKNTILQTQLETSLDAILVVDENESVISYNHQFIDLWKIPPQIAGAGADAPMIAAVADQLANPQAFVAGIAYLYAHQEAKSADELLLKDGRSIDRYSAPIAAADNKYYGRVWYFRDITERKKAEQKFKDLLESAPDAMLIVSRDGAIVLCNAAAVSMFGWPREELLAQNVDALVPGSLRDKHLERREGFLRQPSAREMGAGLALLALRKDGSEFPAEINLSPLEANDGTVVIAAIRNVTVQKQARARIERLNRIYAVLSGINSLIVRVLDRDELFREACNVAVEDGKFIKAAIAMREPASMRFAPVACRGFGKSEFEGFIGACNDGIDDGSNLLSQAVDGRRPAIANTIKNHHGLSSHAALLASGSRAIAVLPLLTEHEVIGVIVLHSNESGFFDHEEVQLLRQLTEDVSFALDHIETVREVAHLAYFDQLTGLARRMLFLERLAQHLRTAAEDKCKLAVFLIDLERFRNINDSLGRSVGDALLQQVAQWLTLQNGDDNLIARIDADHFAVLLPQVTSDRQLVHLVENMIASFVGHPFHLVDNVFHVACRVGVALYPDDGSDGETLFRNAEAALRKAKVQRERYLFYSPKMTEWTAGRPNLESQLRQALDKEEFVLHYQPKVNLSSGKLIGAEALIRWNDPRTGLVPPGRFIPVLEETGLIFEVGRWALKKAVADFLRWRAAGLPAVRIAVNVSPLQLRHRNFVADVARIVGIDASAPGGLELEITESLIMENVENTIVSLREMRALGIRIAIDDFGTGFSSLAYLAKLPVDTIKIDQSFVMAMTATAEGLALVSTIIQMAHALRLNVVAEGVETEEQSRLLRVLNCDEMQGFLFSKAVPSEIFEARFLAA
jgi:diguanylate cyclase (GGDEF)-like protein/PAS domain S-box-containing protein